MKAGSRGSVDAYASTSSAGHDNVMQQRVFIGDMQRFSVVDLGPRTNAREVLQAIESRGDLSPEEIEGGDWMLFEIANDFGMGELASLAQ